MDKSEKFYLICPVLPMFMQVAECLSACGYLRRCSINSLEDTGGGVNHSDCGSREILSGIGWVTAEFCNPSISFPRQINIPRFLSHIFKFSYFSHSL